MIVIMATAKTRWLDEREQGAWRGYLHMQAQLSARMNRQLQNDSNLSLADFGVLVQLAEDPDGWVRVLELADALRWEKSRLSHHLARMQQRGLIERKECSADKRGAFVVLTPAGRAAIDAAAPMHVETVRRLVFDVITTEQVDALAKITEQVIIQLGSPDPCDGG
jgi:DNA-binding MarR family transcriptional regulator